MMKRKPLAALPLALMLAAVQPCAFGLDLRQALEFAQAQDAQLASARAQLQTLREKVPQAAASLLPNVSSTVTVNHLTLNTQSIGAAASVRSELTASQFAISLNQPLLRLDRFETLEQSRLTVMQGEAALEAARQDLMVRVASAYFDVVAAQDALAAVRAQKRAIAEQLASAQRNFQVGTATITDQQEAQARADLTDSQEIGAENDLGNKRNALAVLTGRPLIEMNTLDGLRPGVAMLPPNPVQDEAWTERARADNLSVRQSALSLEIARREINKARFAHWPTIDVVGSANRSERSTVNPAIAQSNSMALGLQLAVPIYSGGALVGRERETVAASEKASADLENARRTADLSARQLVRKVISGLAQVRALEAAERSSQLALDSNLLGYQVGVRINIDVLNAQQQLFSTRRDLSLARYTVLVDGLRLRQAVGGLSDEDLNAVNALLAPLANPAPVPTARTVPMPGMTSETMGSAATPLMVPSINSTAEPSSSSSMAAPKRSASSRRAPASRQRPQPEPTKALP